MNIRLINDGYVMAVENLYCIQITDKELNLIFDEKICGTIPLDTLPSDLFLIIDDAEEKLS